MQTPAVAGRGPLGSPLGAAAVLLGGGELAMWQRRNLDSTLPHILEQLDRSGAIHNFESIADGSCDDYRGGFPFIDTDVYKTVEAVAYALARDPRHPNSPLLRQFFERAVRAIEGAQLPDGYVGTLLGRSAAPRARWSQPAVDHELYNLGHLVQAALAAVRQLGDTRLLSVAIRFADLAEAEFHRGSNAAAYDGHPGAEMALVELSRETGDPRYTQLADTLIRRRGSGLFRGAAFPLEYFQDHIPFGEVQTPTGHAVRFCYLAAGATDVAVARKDEAELARLLELWRSMVATKSFITGGVGSRHSGEDFGDAYELSSERAYAETCAAIGVMQWGFRLLLATGEAEIAEHLERVLYNAFAAGLSVDGTSFFYVNPLQRRSDRAELNPQASQRAPWFSCACCPPNVARWMEELQDHLVLADEASVTIAISAAATIRTGLLDARIDTDAPWNAWLKLSIERAAPELATLRMRSSSAGAQVLVNGEPAPIVERGGWVEICGPLSAGDVIELHSPVRAELFEAHPALDAVRGTVAVVRGPVVYCVEQHDLGASVDHLVIDRVLDETPEGEAPSSRDPRLLGVGLLRAPVTCAPYAPVGRVTETHGTEVTFPLVPYAHWANRTPGDMRVWIRRDPRSNGARLQRGNDQ